jgi:cation:H+ antiporter
VILVLSALYVVLAVGQLVRRRHIGARTARDGVVTPLPELAGRSS